MKDDSKKILVLGITGSFGGGKTTLAGMFKSLGASVIDADKIYHRLISPGTSVYKRVVSIFGREILKKNRQIDRKKLAQVAFNNRASLKRLSQITHPAIIRKIKIELSKLKRAKGFKMAVIDAPLLIEAGSLEMVDKLIVVKTAGRNQIARCKRHWKLSRAKIAQRIKSQAPLKEKIKLADYAIDNNGTLRETREQVKNIWKKIKN